ncbi:unnamed protein product [Diplocarpon coronariae]
MAPAELNYAVHNKEILAIIRSFGHFRAELAGAPYRIAELLSEYDFTITYRPVSIEEVSAFSLAFRVVDQVLAANR